MRAFWIDRSSGRVFDIGRFLKNSFNPAGMDIQDSFMTNDIEDAEYNPDD